MKFFDFTGGGGGPTLINSNFTLKFSSQSLKPLEFIRFN